MIVLKNERISAKINERGAELKSLRRDEVEYIWEGKPEIWNFSAPLLFPICGGLKDDCFTHGGKTYQLQQHGYARMTDFEVESATDTCAVFLHRSDEETKKSFPFDYELRVRYSLEGDALRIDYLVRNTGEETMYFNIGSHEGFYTPEGIEDYDVIFPEKETLNTCLLCGKLLSGHHLPILKDSSVLSLYEKYFTVNALVFKDLVSRSVVLRNRKTGRAIGVEFPDAPYFLIWHKPGSPYICLEPWNGIPDSTEADGELSHKEAITALAAHEEFYYSHTVTVLA